MSSMRRGRIAAPSSGRERQRRAEWSCGAGEDDGLVGLCLLSDLRPPPQTPTFERFRTHRDLTEAEARKMLRDVNCEYYWDLCLNYDAAAQ